MKAVSRRIFTLHTYAEQHWAILSVRSFGFLLLLKEIYQTQWLKQSALYLLPNHSLLYQVEKSDSKMAPVTWLASQCWQLARSLTGDAGWGLGSLPPAPLQVARLDFFQ